MFAARQRLIALYVDVNVGIDRLRDFVHPIGSAAMFRRSQAIVPAVLAADRRNLFRIGGHDDILQLRARAGSVVNMRQHGTAGNLAKNFARQAGRGQPRGNNGDSFHGD